MESKRLKLADALAAARSEMPPAKRNAVNPEFGSSYADQAAVHDAVSPALAKYGIHYGQKVRFEHGAYWSITEFRRGNEVLEYSNPICSDPKQGSHRFESAATQAHRVCLARACGLAIGLDDDGNLASGKRRQQAQQQPRQQQERPRQEQQRQQPAALPELSVEQVSEVAQIIARIEEIEDSPTLRDYLEALKVQYPDERHPVRQHVRPQLASRLKKLDERAFAA
ncbi:ERF family protein [Vulgatibacter sp.]|uniref:ERF family protein n=1 Tax=Vulgatibacter sp. TaxID=1971226 RepID=UPI0035689FF4